MRIYFIGPWIIIQIFSHSLFQTSILEGFYFVQSRM